MTLLKLVDVSAPDVNHIFSPSGKIEVRDLSAEIFGNGFLQSRIYRGLPGSPAEGLYAYEYRVDLTDVVGDPRKRSVTALKVDFGPVVGRLDYEGDGTGDQVFVTTDGGLGSVAPRSADKVDARITFGFDPPVRCGRTRGTGQSSFFFGLVSRHPHRRVSARVRFGDGSHADLRAWAPDPSAG